MYATTVAQDEPEQLASTTHRNPPVELIRKQLEEILTSTRFARSERLRRFLRFIVEETLTGRSDLLKEYTVARQAYDRSAEFNPATDTIVRVEARRLRMALQKYYLLEGRSDVVWIDVPKGGYEPKFRWRKRLPSPIEQATRLRSVAVLPFEDRGPDRDQDFFCEGITEEVVNRLTQAEGLRVTTHASNVGTIVGGTVRKEGDQVRVTAQLVSVADGCYLWSQRYDVAMKEMFVTQDEIAGAVAEAVKARLGIGPDAAPVSGHEGEPGAEAQLSLRLAAC